jgi:tetratricopeptide (TPR) repeat protein
MSGAAPDPLLFPLEEAVLLGTGLPPQVVAALDEASAHYADEERAEACLQAAYALAPEHPTVLIGLYRFYFYKGRLMDAVVISTRCVVKAARLNGLRMDWRQVCAADAAFSDFGAVLPRFYLFSLKAYPYLRLRLGDVDEGRDAVEKLLELDPTDKINARVLLDVLNRSEQPDGE